MTFGSTTSDHVAAAAAVAAVRAAERLELLPVDRGAAVAAVAGGDVQHDAVDERRHWCTSHLCASPKSCWHDARRADREPGAALLRADVWLAASGGLGSVRDDVDDPAAAAGAELDVPADEREQRVVVATADAGAGVEVGAALADDDLAGVDELAAEALDAEALGVGVAAVAATRTRPSCVPWVSAYFPVSMPVTRTWRQLAAVARCACGSRSCSCT